MTHWLYSTVRALTRSDHISFTTFLAYAPFIFACVDLTDIANQSVSYFSKGKGVCMSGRCWKFQYLGMTFMKHWFSKKHVIENKWEMLRVNVHSWPWNHQLINNITTRSIQLLLSFWLCHNIFFNSWPEIKNCISTDPLSNIFATSICRYNLIRKAFILKS